MKQLSILILSLISFSQIKGQETIIIEADKAYMPINKKFGIGLNNPATELDVNGGIKLGHTTVSQAGVLRYNNGDVEVYDGSQWKGLIQEIDGSITNELQSLTKSGSTVILSHGGGSFIDAVNDSDANSSNELITNLSISGNTLQITENSNFKSVSLSNFKGPFERNGNNIRATGNYGTDNFLFGRSEPPQPGQVFSDNLVFFSKEKGAFRAGRIQSTQFWVNDSIGYRSTAFGFNPLASGLHSFSTGIHTKARGAASFVAGDNSVAQATGSMSIGYYNRSEGEYSGSLGYRTIAPSYIELAIGTYNTDYNPTDLEDYDENDRLFVIGNGTGINTRKDALSLWKNGQMGLGVSIPDARMHIKADINEDALEIFIGNKREFFIAHDGQIGIGDIANPDAKVYVDAEAGEDVFRVRSDGTTKFKVNANGGIRNSNATASKAFQLQNSSSNLLGIAEAFSWNTYSDQRIKSNIRPIDYGLSEILQLAPKSYDHHDSEYEENGRMKIKAANSTKDIGLLAQEVYKIIPEAVSKPLSDDDLWSMDYTRLVPVLIESIQEQQKMIDSFSTQLEAQQKQIEKLTALIEQKN